MSTTDHPAWSDLDLAAYLDAELDPDVAARLATALRTDASLRARLTQIRAADAAVLTLAHNLSATPPRRGAARAGIAWRNGPVVRLASGIAAAALVALVAWLAWRPGNPSVPADASGGTLASDAPGRSTSEPAQPGASTTDAGLVRVSLGIARPRATPPESEVLGPPVPDRSGSALRGLEPTRGPSEARTPRARITPDPTVTEDPMLIIARGVRSPDEGNAVLDLLDPAAQLRACAIWATVPRTRPIAFERLARLASDPALSDQARAILHQLERRPDLVPWLRMHALAAESIPPASIQ